MLTKAQILAAVDIQFAVVAVPEWAGEVRIKSMTGADRDAHEQWMMAQPEVDGARRLENFRGHMAAMSIVDEAGARVFSDDDVAALGNKSASALQRVYDKMVELNALAKKDIDDIVKN